MPRMYKLYKSLSKVLLDKETLDILTKTNRHHDGSRTGKLYQRLIITEKTYDIEKIY